MRVRAPQLSALICLLLCLCALPSKTFAQYDPHDDDEVPIIDSANKFCVVLQRIMVQTEMDFEAAKAEMIDSVGQKAWDCQDNYKMCGSRHCTVFANGGKTTYVAFYLSRATKDALASSYNNLLHMLKDCLGPKYTYKEKKANAAEKLLGTKYYECELVPVGDAVRNQADMRVTIEQMPTGEYELIFEVMKYRGYY